MAITPTTNIFQITSSNTANWLATAVVNMQNQSDGALVGSLSIAAKNQPGSIATFLANSSANANNLLNVASSAVTSATQLAIQQGDAVAKQRQQNALDKALADLQSTQNAIVPKDVLDPTIYFNDGSTLDTTNNIFTRADGSQYDATTGAPYVNPADIVQLANGAYLNTASNVMTMPDGTQIDMITGLNVNQLNQPDSSGGGSS
ncbi:MAG: hypothetical protein JO205_08175 [Pseudolabrys sp.]|nr:hypothetical protein [Pseudolabrys sp.]